MLENSVLPSVILPYVVAPTAFFSVQVNQLHLIIKMAIIGSEQTKANYIRLNVIWSKKHFAEWHFTNGNLVDWHFVDTYIVSYPQVKQLCLFNQVYSMIASIKSTEYLFEITTGENRVGSKNRGRGREREQQINRMRDGALDRNGNGVGWKWLLVKKDTQYF